MIQQHQANTDTTPSTVVADKAYGRVDNYKALQQQTSRRAFRTASLDPNTKANSHGVILGMTPSKTVIFVLPGKG